MEQTIKHNALFLNALLTISLACLSACDKEAEVIENGKVVSSTPVVKVPAQVEKIPQDDKIIIDNKSYLFDVTNHSIDELRALLARAEEVSQAQSEEFSDLKIVMIIHGPDIEWFTQKNHEQNQQLIDLAARLDAYDIIDMKVCEKTLSSMGVERGDIPSFIESVPYAPVEIKQRLQDGYINL